MRISRQLLMAILVVTPFAFLVMSGGKEYIVWGQVLFLWERGVDPYDVVIRIPHAHGPRYALMYPILALADGLTISADYLFGLVVVVFCIATSRNVVLTFDIFHPGARHNWITLAAVYLFFTSLFILMNGRISFSFVGFSLVVLALTRITFGVSYGFGQILRIMFGVILCTVSSGTFISCGLAVLATMAFTGIRLLISGEGRRGFMASSIATFLVLLPMLPFIIIFIVKNVTFFGGGFAGVMNMLNHGAGKIITKLDLQGGELVLPLLSLALLAGGSYYLLWREGVAYPGLILFTSLAIGTFGFSTMSIAAVPLIIVVFLVLWKIEMRLSRTVGR